MKISIIGLGFVGLSLASVLAAKGNNILGIDIDEHKCQNIRKGVSPFFEPELERLLKIGLKKKLEISTDFTLIKNSDISLKNKIIYFYKEKKKFIYLTLSFLIIILGSLLRRLSNKIFSIFKTK